MLKLILSIYISCFHIFELLGFSMKGRSISCTVQCMVQGVIVLHTHIHVWICLWSLMMFSFRSEYKHNSEKKNKSVYTCILVRFVKTASQNS